LFFLPGDRVVGLPWAAFDDRDQSRDLGVGEQLGKADEIDVVAAFAADDVEKEVSIIS